MPAVKPILLLVSLCVVAGCATAVAAPAVPPRAEPPLYGADAAGAQPVAEPYVGRPDAPRTVDLVELAFRIVRADGTVVTAPRVTMFAGQRGNISIVSRTSFIGDFDVETAQQTSIADPVIDTITDGVVADVVPRFVAADRSQIALAFAITSSALRRPIRTFDIASLLAGGLPVTIQLPATETLEVRGARRLADGRETEIARLPSASGVLVVLCSATRSEWTESDSPPATEAEVAAASRDAADPDVPTGAAPSPGAVLVRLARLAAEGAPAKLLRADAVRSPSIPVLDASRPTPADEILGTISATTILAEGVRLANHLDERYVSGYDLRGPKGAVTAADPRIATQVSGMWAEMQGDGRCRARWTVTPRIEARRILVSELGHGAIPGAAVPSLPVEVPHAWSTSIALVPAADWEPTAGLLPGAETLHVRVTAGAAE